MKKAGDTIVLTYERSHETHNTELMIDYFKDADHKGRAGVGIGLVDDKQILVEPQVSVNTEEIGGPSAGFMFSLEIYNQLTKKDLTKGYEIAGTGTIFQMVPWEESVALSKKLLQQIKQVPTSFLHQTKMDRRIPIIMPQLKQLRILERT